MAVVETRAEIRIPHSHDQYRLFIELLQRVIAPDGLNCTENGVSFFTMGGYRIDLLPEDGKIAVAVTDEEGLTIALPDSFEADDEDGFYDALCIHATNLMRRG